MKEKTDGQKNLTSRSVLQSIEQNKNTFCNILASVLYWNVKKVWLYFSNLPISLAVLAQRILRNFTAKCCWQFLIISASLVLNSFIRKRITSFRSPIKLLYIWWSSVNYRPNKDKLIHPWFGKPRRRVEVKCWGWLLVTNVSSFFHAATVAEFLFLLQLLPVLLLSYEFNVRALLFKLSAF